MHCITSFGGVSYGASSSRRRHDSGPDLYRHDLRDGAIDAAMIVATEIAAIAIITITISVGDPT